MAFEHDLRLVALSALLCLLGCYTTATLLARAQLAGRELQLPWIGAAAAIFGCSVWSLHFVAMLAFMPGMTIGYSVDLTVLSLLVAMGGALASLLVWFSPRQLPLRTILAGGVLGLAVTGMHYLGAAAMRFSGLIMFDFGQVAVSVAVSIALSTLALRRAANLRTFARRAEVTVWLTVAICGLHFTGMSAITLTPGVADQGAGIVLGSSMLAAVVGTVGLGVALAALVAVLMEQHLFLRAVQELARMRLLNDLAHEVMIIQRDGVVLEINSAGERLFSRKADQIVGTPLTALFSEDSIPALLRRSLCPVEERRPEEMEVRSSAGVAVSVELSCQQIEYLGKPATAIALRDLSERKRDEAKIRHLARHDAVTGLPNRYNLQERLGHALDTASHNGEQLAVLYIDLDRFKQVNDVFGHAVGDTLLLQVSKRVLTEIRPTDTLARIGGDEFVMLLKDALDPERAAIVATRVLAAIARPFQIGSHHIEIGASIGIALYPQDGGSADTLLRAADTAMYRVKDDGRAAFRFFEPSMDAQLQARHQLAQELATAMERNELVLHYQPMVNGITGELETFEALIRWPHPKRGMVGPVEFIPLAEEAGLIGALGKWVIDTACREAASWPHPWRVSVNVSPVQFRTSDICGTVAAALAGNQLDASRLVVEITEGVLISDAGKAIEILTRLREMGIRLALDDFGTGYSSLSYLQRFKFDKFKIDKSFVQRLGQSEDALTIVRTVVNLGHNLGLHVTAEGVESVEQLGILQSLGCDQIQGYLVARPAPVEALTELDRARARSLFQTERRKRIA